MESSSDGGAKDPGDDSVPGDGNPSATEDGGFAETSTTELDSFDFEATFMKATETQVLSLQRTDMTLMNSAIADQIRAMVRGSNEVDLRGDENDAEILSIFQDHYMRPVVLRWVHSRYTGMGGEIPTDEHIWKAYTKDGMLPNLEQKLEPRLQTKPYKRPRRTKAQMEAARAEEERARIRARREENEDGETKEEERFECSPVPDTNNMHEKAI